MIMCMNDKNRIPLTVGITGHIDLRERDRDSLYRAVKGELARLRDRYPHTPLRMLCSLAAGADLLCADAAEELGIPLTAVLPLAVEDYRQDFREADLAKLNRHLDRAETVFTAPAAELLIRWLLSLFLYGYEGGEYSLIHLRWDDGAGVLTPSEGYRVTVVG